MYPVAEIMKENISIKLLGVGFAASILASNTQESNIQKRRIKI